MSQLNNDHIKSRDLKNIRVMLMAQVTFFSQFHKSTLKEEDCISKRKTVAENRVALLVNFS